MIPQTVELPRTASEPIRVSVTDDDIAKGKPGDPCACVIALALNRTTGERWTVGRWRDKETHPYAWKATVSHPSGNRIYFQLPVKAGILAHDFDAGRLVLPISFELGEAK